MQMQVLFLFALVAGAFAETKCPANSEYVSCGTGCPLTCDNYQNPPRFCFLICKSGCQCDKGYVKDKTENCVLPANCPVQAAEKDCVSDADTGLCKGYFPRWYYDKNTGDCIKFIYGGCGGNGNRYSSKEECQQRCGA